jgi:plastocyanin
VVPRFLGGRRALVPPAALAIALLAFAAPASANNTRVEISNFEWSNKQVHIDLGESVTWDWLGPDLAHSVTGISANALGWDSDPNTDAPDHRPGDTYSIQFNAPGTYEFQCKLHNFVRGDVVVSDIPGNPNSDPGPQPPLRIDITKPTLGGVRLEKQVFNSRKGVPTTAEISKRGTLDAEYYRINSKGRRVYNGYATWKTHIGINRLSLGAGGKHFKARPGRYHAVLRATDEAANESKPVKKAFTIR